MGAKKSPAATEKKEVPAEKNKGGRPKIPFTEKELKQASSMAGHGLNMEQISGVLGMSKSTLEQRLHDTPGGFDALEEGRSEAISMVAQSAYLQAIGKKLVVVIRADGKRDVVQEDTPPNPQMTKFFLNVRANWIERKAVELANPEGEEFKVVFSDYRGKK